MNGPRDARAAFGGTRLAALCLLAAAAVGLWQALRLDRWGFDGPGAGLFPQIVAGVCVLLSIVVLVFPGRAASTEDGDTDEIDDATRAATRSTFSLYVVALLVLAAGAAFGGFVVTVIAVTLLVLRFAERRSWRHAIVYGVACALIGLVGFGWLLRVDLPESPIERAFYSLVR
ncbi:MAG TPA: tripartite tricarboxylate transporter TctB family protein [Quisquiliibacterium sp.]|nr:tripartite tricarboxylate transporter TctB family protein [Quisquiliibacterium sp.]HQD81913.1 tripartite tricarboxylate transporter TctB family protein [Quisquiliibacterium sp.]HQN13684.1 tripartite tricarboxylate transporter TctB family protein [Quisquiliibacterium sp.]HQP66965.1 tripartite tricarboxylate transporter TctB family protein [Quisquiliibacterium sp.]